jgi:tetratricopeptide (TPR) repeat protein
MSVRTIIFLVLVFLIPFRVDASKKFDIDSLQQVLVLNISDTSRLNTMARLAQGYLDMKKYPEAKKIALEALNLAHDKELKSPYFLHWTLAEIHLNQGEPRHGLEQMEIVLKQLRIIDNKQKIAEAQNLVGYLYLWSGKFSESIETYNTNIEFAKKHNLKNILSSAYSGLSYVYMNLENTEEQRKHLILMADAAAKEENNNYAAHAYLRLGDIGMNYDSNFNYAISHYQQSLKYRGIM